MIPSQQDLFERFTLFVKELPEKNQYVREDLLTQSLQLFADDKVKIYYAPTDYINSKAKVFILGITPGWAQMEIFYRVARSVLLAGDSASEASCKAKQHASFAGVMRKNMVTMLDELGLAKALSISTTADLFSEDCNLLHSSSIIRYPVFVNEKNYTGHGIDPLRHCAMKNIIETCLNQDILETKDALIIPLGDAVNKTLQYFINLGKLDAARCLFGFPHPSGANGHRKIQFQQNKNNLTKIIQEWFTK